MINEKIGVLSLLRHFVVDIAGNQNNSWLASGDSVIELHDDQVLFIKQDPSHLIFVDDQPLVKSVGFRVSPKDGFSQAVINYYAHRLLKKDGQIVENAENEKHYKTVDSKSKIEHFNQVEELTEFLYEELQEKIVNIKEDIEYHLNEKNYMSGNGSVKLCARRPFEPTPESINKIKKELMRKGIYDLRTKLKSQPYCPKIS